MNNWTWVPVSPLSSSLPGLVLDLALGSSGISLFGMNGGGLAQEPVGILPGCVHLTLVRIQQPQVGLSLQPLLPVNASEVNHKEKKKSSQNTLESRVLGVYVRNCLNSFSPLLLLD